MECSVNKYDMSILLPLIFLLAVAQFLRAFINAPDGVERAEGFSFEPAQHERSPSPYAGIGRDKSDHGGMAAIAVVNRAGS